jgi:hypothetical protein
LDPDPYPDPYWPPSGSSGSGSGSVKNEYGSETLTTNILLEILKGRRFEKFQKSRNN